jgi:uncharacterized protein (DUF1501 family)
MRDGCNRRRFLGLAATLAGSSAWPRPLPANDRDRPRLAVVVLRGALDGLAAVMPYGDRSYRQQRAQLALSEYLKLDDLFALHPSLATLARLYAEGQLAIVHAVGSPYRERSHFDGQKVLENGTTGPATRDGWLNRALGVARGIGSARGLALGHTVPLVLRGPNEVDTWAPTPLPAPDEDTLARIAAMYEADGELATQLQRAFESRELMPSEAGPPRRRRAGSLEAFAAAGRLLALADGPAVAVLESHGWDTHANQGARDGPLAARLALLDEGVAALQDALAAAWHWTVILIVTEFGRTVRPNGTGGTDHGTATAAFALGGAVAGGRVIADWPGLAGPVLHDGRDLRPTTDIRALFKAVLHEHFGVADSDLETGVFPDSRGVARIEGLLRRPVV